MNNAVHWWQPPPGSWLVFRQARLVPLQQNLKKFWVSKCFKPHPNYFKLMTLRWKVDRRSLPADCNADSKKCVRCCRNKHLGCAPYFDCDSGLETWVGALKILAPGDPGEQIWAFCGFQICSTMTLEKVAWLDFRRSTLHVRQSDIELLRRPAGTSPRKNGLVLSYLLFRKIEIGYKTWLNGYMIFGYSRSELSYIFVVVTGSDTATSERPS